MEASSCTWEDLEALVMEITDIEHVLHGMRVGPQYVSLNHESHRLAVARFRCAALRRLFAQHQSELGHLMNSMRRRSGVDEMAKSSNAFTHG